MNFLPICINIHKKNILVVGGGKIGWQKIKTLLKYTRRITVCAPEICKEIRMSRVHVIKSSYHKGLLEGHHLIYACTNSKIINRRISRDARLKNILMCASDDPEICDFISPAIVKRGMMSVAVSSNARNAKKSVAWKNRIRKMLIKGFMR